MRENRLTKTIQEAQSGKQTAGDFSSVLIADSADSPTFGYPVNYSFMRCPQYVRLSDKEDVFLFESEGLKFAIQGENIFQLVRMINMRNIAEVFSGSVIRNEGHNVLIKQILVEEIENDKNVGESDDEIEE